jgi:hypothetical protein
MVQQSWSEERLGARLGGDWELRDFGEFNRSFAHLYAFVYSIKQEVNENLEEMYNELYVAHPWRGGWSAYNFFETLHARIPKAHRPKILSLEIHSPGLMEIGLVLAVGLAAVNIIKNCSKKL